MKMAMAALVLVVCAGIAPSGQLHGQVQAAERPGPDSVVFNPSRGSVTFAHARHAGQFECVQCHHESRPEKPLTEAREKCSACHTTPATEPMKTNRRNAFHDVMKKAGTCYTCHNEEAAKGKPAPTTCDGCHKAAGAA